MIPLPIALVVLFYAVLATLSAVTVWKIVTGLIAQPVIWPVAWLALSGSVVFGLSLLKNWGRGLAIVASSVMILIMLALAGLLVVGGRPLAGMLATLTAAVHVVVIRYLHRPVIRAYFTSPAQHSEHLTT